MSLGTACHITSADTFTNLRFATVVLLSRIDSSSVMKDIKVTVVCHPQGHGTEDDLEKLLEDLKGYKEVELLRCSD